ncbi:nucleotide exchange factor GrpE [Luteipulveratus halotolerans]|uniref:Protein GrpE n=1 Tax=Luteipulveratus halotolerans TaxID=1631356 RepID=A0A0L6CKU3_9MICO|nr:nucleotide exchange factor GrpE [Luteipulveratus halotolerans]KNX38377.1 GrpE protein HSP-70 cofactor [Luteipulveratus halotolerans]
MTDARSSAGSQEEPAEGPVIRDKRRLDPQTGEVRDQQTAEGSSSVTDDSKPADGEAQPTTDETVEASASTDVPEQDTPQAEQSDADVAAGLQDELLRERAAFHNYRELMKRERPKDREQAIGTVVESLLPVLDDIFMAEQHGDLKDSPFEKIAVKLETTLGKHGVQRFGEVGEAFDPQHHEALMHVEAEVPEGAESTTVVQVMQPGYRVGDRVVRPARVAVADPQ